MDREQAAAMIGNCAGTAPLFGGTIIHPLDAQEVTTTMVPATAVLVPEPMETDVEPSVDDDRKRAKLDNAMDES